MKNIILLFIVGFISASVAQEFPVPSNTSGFFNFNPSIFDRTEINLPVSSQPVWSMLDRMELSERNNSLIDIEYNSDALSATFKQITTLWNKGKFNEALDLFRSIDDNDLKGVSIGINWKVPTPTVDQAKWGTDVRIGNRDSIEIVSLAFQKSTGNLFAILVYQELGGYYYTVNLSSNGGTTWTETFVYSAGGPIKIVSASATVVDSFCYVGYAYEGAKNIGRLRRFETLNGASATFIDGAAFKNVLTLAATDSVKEVVVSSNQNDFNNRLYFAAITKTDSLIGFWNNEANVTYNKYITAFVDADKGLDLSWNNGFTGTNYTYYLLGSYVTKTRGIKFFGVLNDSLKQLGNFYTGFVNDYSSISAHHDTITAAFEYSFYNRYLVSYNGGTTWAFGLVGDTLVTSERPDIAAGDGGVGIIYRYYTPTREGRFVWRPMAGAWSTPVKYTDYEPYFNKPAIEYLGNKKFGVVYLCWSSPVVRGAYFDLNNMATDIDDQFAEQPTDFSLLQNYPNPFNPATLIRYQIPTQSSVSIKVYDALGNLIQYLVNEEKPAGVYELEFNASKLASGVYFYTIQAGSFVQTKKMLLVR